MTSRRALLACLLAGCHDATTPAWQLDRDRIVAARSTPPGLLPGEVGRLDALIAHAGGPVVQDQPDGASAPFAPAGLFIAVHYNIDHWEVNGPEPEKLDEARAELGLPDGAPVPLEITVEFPGPLYATKTVWLGEARANPALPYVSIDGAGVPSEVVLAAGTEARLAVAAEPTDHVRWLTSCGELEDDDRAIARLRAEGTCAGELVVVVRDAVGGVVWHVWPLHME